MTLPPRVVDSFDVFDTVLTRVVGMPDSLFYLLGAAARREGLVEITPRSFRWHRMQAEIAARAEAPGNEPTLEEIYELLSCSLRLPSSDDLMERELRMEQMHLRTRPVGVERVLRARTSEHQVAYLSDTYFPRAFVEARLAEHGLLNDDDLVLISCELRKSKRDGTLFAELEDRVRSAGSRLGGHCGDHPASDFEVPTELGLRSELLPLDVTRFERTLERSSRHTGGVTSVLAGVSKTVRENLDRSDEAVGPLDDVAAGVLAPLLVLYCDWCIERAHLTERHKIAFVARDGYLLRGIAAQLEPTSAEDFLYLLGSRQSLHLAALGLETAVPSWVTEHIDRQSGESILDRLGLDIEVVPASLRGAFGAADWSLADVRRRKELVSEVVDQPSCAKAIAARSQEQRTLLLDLLDGMGLGHESWAFVDTGWHGRSAASLIRVLQDAGRTVPMFLYLGLYTIPVDVARCEWDTFLFGGPRHDESTAHHALFAVLVELACTAPHGSIRRYERRHDGSIGAVLGPDPRHSFTPFERIHKVVQSWTKEFCRTGLTVEDCGAAWPFLIEVVDQFLCSPTPAEARVWGRLPFADSQGDDDYRSFASEWSLKDVLRAAFLGRLSEFAWTEGSIASMPPRRSGALKAALAGRDRARRLKRQVSSYRAK